MPDNHIRLLEALQDLGDSPEANIRELARRYQSLFSTPEGQLVLEDLKQRGFIYDTTESDTHDKTLVNEGSRQMILYIIKMLDLDTTKVSDSANP